jgi:hypothetical protein
MLKLTIQIRPSRATGNWSIKAKILKKIKSEETARHGATY